MADKEEKIVNSLDKISEKLEAIDKTIRETVIKAKKEPFDKEIELQKIQLLNDDYQSYFNVAGSILAGGFVSLTVLIITLFLFFTLVALILIVVVSVLIVYAFVWLELRKRNFFALIDELTEKIRNNETIEPMSKLRKRIKTMGK